MANLIPALFVLALVSIIHGKQMQCYQCMDSKVFDVGTALMNIAGGNNSQILDMPNNILYSDLCGDPSKLRSTDSTFISSKCTGNCVKRKLMGHIYRFCDDTGNLKTNCKHLLSNVKSECSFVCSNSDLCNSQPRVGYSASLLVVIIAFVVLRAQ